MERTSKERKIHENRGLTLTNGATGVDWAARKPSICKLSDHDKLHNANWFSYTMYQIVKHGNINIQIDHLIIKNNPNFNLLLA